MKALISGFALLTFLAATTLPLESYGQTSTGSTTTAAPDTGTLVTSPTKKSKKSKSHAKRSRQNHPRIRRAPLTSGTTP